MQILEGELQGLGVEQLQREAVVLTQGLEQLRTSQLQKSRAAFEGLRRLLRGLGSLLPLRQLVDRDLAVLELLFVLWI